MRKYKKCSKLGVIEETTSPWNSPVLVIPKKDGSMRFCADLRKLNERTIKDVFPIPHLQDTLDSLGNKAFFSTLDLKSGYWQIAIPPADRPKTAFSTRNSHYQWCRAPFGFCNMPSIFQRMMTKLLLPCAAFTLVYLDDIIIFSSSLEEHFQHIQQVLQILAKANLTVNLPKCKFFQTSFTYLGHLIDAHGIRPNPEKVKALRDLSPPTTRTQLMSFLGLVNWFRRFIPHLAELTSSLSPLTSKSTQWTWTPDHDAAFTALKTALSADSFVRFPDFSQPFILACDASNHQVGAVLLQQFDAALQPVYYFSKTLDTHQQKYSVTEKECLAIVLAVKTFHVYLHGTFFIVRTDHRALVWLSRMKDTSSKLLRWSMFLQNYNFLIVYGKGEANVVADALSRLQTQPHLPVDENHQLVPQNILRVLPQNLITFRNTVQTKTSGPRNENWIGRHVQVLGSWFNNNKDNAKDTYTMQVIDFKEGKLLRQDRWVVRLQPTDGSPAEDFLMNYSAMCKYLLPVQPTPVAPPTSSQTPVHHAVPTLHSDLPSLQDFIMEQQKDASLQFWYKWLKEQQVPTGVDSTSLWFQADKDVVFLNEIGLLCRLASLTTSTASRKTCQIVVPTVFQNHVLHFVHGSETSGHQGFFRSFYHLSTQFFWQHMREDLQRYIKSCSCQGLKPSTSDDVVALGDRVQFLSAPSAFQHPLVSPLAPLLFLHSEFPFHFSHFR